jgi:hypothetical protein
MKTTMRRRLLASLQAVYQRAMKRRPKAPRSETTLCRRKTFKPWSRPDRRGWTLRGRFYGAQGQFLGKRFSLGEGDLACGVVAFGGPATDLVLFPAIADRMRDGHSLVVTDTSGILLCHIQAVAATTGHLLLVHDLDRPAISCALNPCEWIDGVSEARDVAAILVSGAYRRAPTGGPRATRQAVDLLAACLLHYRSFGKLLDAQRDVPRLARELAHSQVPGVADLVAGLKAEAARGTGLAAGITAIAFGVGLAPWTNSAVREISAHSDTLTSPLSAGLDLPAQLAGLPTVIILRYVRRQADLYGPYLGMLLYALAARLARAPSAGSLPVGLILENLADLGRLDTLIRHASGSVPILAAADSIVEFDRFYPAREEAERMLDGLATQIVFGGRDQPTAEFVCRLGGGLILPQDVTGLAQDHAIVLARAGGEDQAARVIFHGTPTPFSKREDWKPGQAQLKSITVIPRPPNASSKPSQPSGRPHSPPKQAEPASARLRQSSVEPSTEPVGSKTKGRTPAYDAIERLLADAPKSDRKKDRDLWTNENW